MEKLNEFLASHLHFLKPHLEPYVDELKSAVRPATEKLPDGVQRFLEEGGWYWVLGLVFVVFLVWVYSLIRRMLRALFSPRSKGSDWAEELQEDLDEYAVPSEPTGDRVIGVKGIPARLRLVVLAPAGKDVELSPGMAEKILEHLVPGLGEIGMADDPRIRVWPAQYSFDGFAYGFLHHVRSPDAPGTMSRWILIAGMIQIARQKTHVGLVLWSNKPNTIGRVKLKSQQFSDVLKLQKTRD